MKSSEFAAIDAYMKEIMSDVAHDHAHVYRVLYMALDILEHETGADADILIAACLLHDIGRQIQSKNLDLCHAEIGGKMAYDFLIGRNWSRDKAQLTASCVRTHRFRKGEAPACIEGKILFDADKLDSTGAIGIARTLIYSGQINEPLYVIDNEGDLVTSGAGAEKHTFIQEYNFKLKNIYDGFYTCRAREIAAQRRSAAIGFYESLELEIIKTHNAGIKALESRIN